MVDIHYLDELKPGDKQMQMYEKNAPQVVAIA